jgi:pimeloyl-ACP methyl ester carboxylesterase
MTGSTRPTGGTSYSRTPFLIVQREQVRRKDVYGSIDDHVVLQAQLLRGETPSSTVIIAMHPIGSPGYLPMFSGLARAGFDVIACATRYSTGDAALQMENVLLDLGACVKDARERLGYEQVLLAGWSGGGSLMLGYQAEAEKPRITQTAAGEYTPLADTQLSPADGVLVLAAHRSRHTLLTEFLDPSVIDEANPSLRDRDWNLYDPANPAQPPYDPGYLDEYRTRQVARNRSITAWAKEQLETLRRAGREDDERCFVVYGTMADPRWVDITVDPNDRVVGSYLGDPRIVNDSAAGLARFTTTRSWLSQWSIDDAQVDGVEGASRLSVPILILVNTADDACPTTHTDAIYAAVPHADKELVRIVGANHYYSGPGQRDHLQTAIATMEDWVTRHDFAGR